MIGSSSQTVNCFPMNPKAAEAELIQKATQTAIIAARSILMSGGTEESALKTAKAAAESVLNPAGSETDTISGISTLGSAFGGKRRKAKRQAEVVASMALMSATCLQPNGGSIIGECDSISKMYGRNIITVRQDEPSVLSGSTRLSNRPPKPPTPKSRASRKSFNGRSQQKETREPVEQNGTPDRPPLPPMSPTSLQSMISMISPKSVQTDQDSQQLNIKTLSHSMSMDSEHESSVESSIRGRSGSEDESDEETAPFFHERKKKAVKFGTKSRTQKHSPWSFSTLMSPLTATLDALQCGQLLGGDAILDAPRLEYRGKDKNTRRSGRRSGRGRQQNSSIFDSRDDTFDDETTAFSCDNKKMVKYRDPDFPGSYSYTSSKSEVTDLSEQDIQVRSSIRETMESIVNKSKFIHRRSKQEENLSSHETKPRSRRSTPRNTATSPNDKKQPKGFGPGMKGKARSFFKREKGR